MDTESRGAACLFRKICALKLGKVKFFRGISIQKRGSKEGLGLPTFGVRHCLVSR